MRIVALAVMALGLIAATGGGKFGDSGSSAGARETQAEIEDDRVRVSGLHRVGGDVAATEAASRVAPATDLVWITYPVLTTDHTGTECRGTGGRHVPAEDAATIQRALADDFDVYITTLTTPAPDGRRIVGPCRAAPAATFDLTPALAFADEVIADLPRPRPTISGPHAITGNRLHLDTRRPISATHERTLHLGDRTAPVTITAEVSFDVDWGDGALTRGHTVPGGPWHGDDPTAADLVHTYTDVADAVTLSVTDRWTVTVHVAGQPDTVLTETLAPVSVTFPVRAVTAVRD